MAGNALPGPNTPHQPQHKEQFQSHDPKIKPPPSKGCSQRSRHEAITSGGCLAFLERSPSIPQHPFSIPQSSLEHPAGPERAARGRMAALLPSLALPTLHIPRYGRPSRERGGAAEPRGARRREGGGEGVEEKS